MTTRRSPQPARRLQKRARTAQVLDVSISTIKRWERAGLLKPIRLGPQGRDVHHDVEQIEELARGDAKRVRLGGED